VRTKMGKSMSQRETRSWAPSRNRYGGSGRKMSNLCRFYATPNSMEAINVELDRIMSQETKDAALLESK